MESIVKGNYGTMYYVADMKKATDYYKNFLGLKPRFESNEWTEFDLGDNTSLCLHGMGDTKPLTQGGVLITKVKNIKTLVPDLKKKGMEFVMDVKEVHPGAWAADFKDPSGNVVSLFEDTNNYK